MVANNTNPLKVLIVDDDKSVLFIFNKILKKVGCHISTLETGEETLRNLESNKYDTAIIDVNLQDMNGLNLLASVNKMAPNMKKIILTGSPSETDKIRSEKYGADYYLVKPIPSKKLVEIVTNSEKFIY
ncbi:MAG: response regulator [Candidatus Bathyarchaeota archaeon]